MTLYILDSYESTQNQGLLCDTSDKIRFTDKSIAFNTFSKDKYKQIMDRKYLNNFRQIENGIIG